MALVLRMGFEPTRHVPLEPKSSMSAYSTTSAYGPRGGSRTHIIRYNLSGQLSYPGILEQVRGIEPPVHSLEGCCTGRCTTPADPPTRIALEAGLFLLRLLRCARYVLRKENVDERSWSG